MAPRTRSNRQEKLAIQKLLSSGISPNTRGFPALPNELYLEILSYLPALPIPHDVEKMDPYRQITLYYLSQTCRSLRKFFLRYAWERIEVFEGMWSPKGRLTTKAERNKRGVDMKNLSDKRQIQETLRQLKTATVRNPDLRQYVSIVNLTILEYSYDSVLPEIAQNLSLFPNLHSLQLISRFVPHEPDQFFSEFRYPNVHTLNVIRLKYGDIFHACPNARYVSSSLHIREILYKECASGIEKLRHVKGLRHFLNDMVRLLPCLCDLFLGLRNLRTSGEGLKCLSSLPLHTIRLRLEYHLGRIRRRVVASPNERQRWIKLAKEILANCPKRGIGKKVIVENYDKSVEVYTVS